jgi:hypothetical protein
MHPLTVVEQFMADYREGWLCFESATSRRRLIGYPADWAESSDAELWDLCEKAELVQRRRPKGGRMEAEGPAASQTPSAEHPAFGLNAVRTFVSTSGRRWTARTVTLPSPRADEPERRVLRFSSSDLTLDVYDWPANWLELDEGSLARLALEGRPAGSEPPAPPSARRPEPPGRRGDRTP